MEEMDCSSYFNSYEDLNIHKIMLTDTARNNAYRTAIFDNQDGIRGKTVLDVGAGTGILSIFCAQAGAAKVYAVEASEVYRIAEEIVKENEFQNVIQVIHSRIEDLDLQEKVDVIVSEWMGFYLLHEGMLDSVITARDKFLKPNGLIFPECATLYAVPCSVPSLFEQWKNINGVSMKVFGEQLRRDAAQKPLTDAVDSESVLADAEVVCWVDLREITHDDTKNFTLKHLAVSTKTGKYQGICLWFACNFPSLAGEPVTLSTQPGEPETHWKQTTIVLPGSVDVEVGTPIAYEICLKRNEEASRRYDIQVTMLDPEEIEHPEYCTCYMTKCILVRAVLEKYEKND